MRIAYLDCFAGVSGDMFLGALLDAGVDPEVLHGAVRALKLGASLRMEKVDRSGITCSKVHVLEGEELAEARGTGDAVRAQAALSRDQFRDQQDAQRESGQWHLETQHQHKEGHAEHGHTHDRAHVHDAEHDSKDHGSKHGAGHESNPVGVKHTHEHAYVHGRSLTVIRELIQSADLAGPVKHMAIRAFELLGRSEAKIHNVPVDEIHFHEVGAVDAIVDIVAAAAGIDALAVDRWVCSPLNVGGGMVDCAHGRFPVPAPATADLLRDMPTYSASIEMELVTPTGAALLRVLKEERGLSFGAQPPMRVQRIGYGAGSRNPKHFPNALRLSVGEGFALQGAGEEHLEEPPPHPHEHAHAPRHEHPQEHERKHRHEHHAQTVTVLEAALDDLSPQVVAHVTESALQQGALDVMLTPVIMKKGRPGTMITILCNPQESARFEELLLSETSTLGVRMREDRRSCLERKHETVHTQYGEIRMKVGERAGRILNASPEFEDCRAASAVHRVPVKQIQQSAIAAYVAAKQVEADQDQ